MTHRVYKPALLSYIDLLGFRDLVERSKQDEDEVSRIVDVLATVKEEFFKGGRIHRDEAGKPRKIFYAFNFSDLTVRCTLAPEGSNISDFLGWELFYLAEEQLLLATQEVLLRGGICLGNICIDNGLIFGPSLVKAYTLEKDYAIFPRIVIDRDLYHLAESHEGAKSWKDYLKRGEDGVYFLNYLFGAFLRAHLAPAEGENEWSLLQGHKEMLERVYDRNIKEKPDRVRQKYLWLGLYHNSTIKELLGRPGWQETELETLRKCLIDSELLRF